ncbi:Cytochrome b5-like Heme/Steroid binding domain [Musa troglodytarum]|uniref:Cytochrome b5-like Heme/Steroid binding domain n=1 Tax=Musa troglodytarum TaxID=320322 RepID=A0A9E7F659_9LILI|nr:Cytochrome b5-like Heme/Steroid binding domain [Musa troglodytarum]
MERRRRGMERSDVDGGGGGGGGGGGDAEARGGGVHGAITGDVLHGAGGGGGLLLRRVGVPRAPAAGAAGPRCCGAGDGRAPPAARAARGDHRRGAPCLRQLRPQVTRYSWPSRARSMTSPRARPSSPHTLCLSLDLLVKP